MPWDIRRGYRDCSVYAVVKESDGSIAGCHETREKALRQIAALEASEADKSVNPEFEKYRGELYAMLTQEEKAFHDSLVSIAQQYGPFDQGTSSIWVGYESAEDNEKAEIGVKCSNCSFFNPENNGCAILSYKVEPMGKCRLAAIPDGLVVSDMNREKQKEFVEEMMENIDKKYTGCGCPTCKAMDVACKDCPVCNPDMNKAGNARVGQMVSWGSSGGRAEGKVKRIIRDGSYNVPDSDFTITGTPDNPAVVIEVYRDGKPTGRMVGHRMSTLSAAKSIWSSFSPDDVVQKPQVSLFKRDYNTESRRRMAASGQAMPDGSFPIANRTDLRNAIQSVGRASNYEAAKRHIIRRARALGATDMLPEDWK
jgi:hypothetical protein